ncbi:hypothetical protein IX318_000495 [Porphyromonas levii]|nr:hypothetical protein [Porphyromonas levii]MBR8714654.1 hypothetical protein [Porphyromonas levii]MBR8727682.1 hypothetical protein [Porphyromonas levii]MBR8731784.1 hypothetical protein [Porphyromonas levii]MBR8736068.1 hypothetical protein [Porphyromonas levii]
MNVNVCDNFFGANVVKICEMAEKSGYKWLYSNSQREECRSAKYHSLCAPAYGCVDAYAYLWLIRYSAI